MKKYWIFNPDSRISSGLYQENELGFLQTFWDIHINQNKNADYWLEGAELPNWYLYILEQGSTKYLWKESG